MTPAERRASLEESIIFDPETDEWMMPELRALWDRSGDRAQAQARQFGLGPTGGVDFRGGA